MKSKYQNLGGVIVMPEFKERKLYMHKTRMDNLILPAGFKDYSGAIEDVLRKVNDRNNVCYITIDEKRISNDTHRRAGIHVDFNWFENLNAHNGGDVCPPPPARIERGGHNGSGSGGHSSNIPSKPAERGGHIGSIGTHNSLSEFNKNGGMLLVSNYEGCMVYKGEFDGIIGDGGCCANIDVSSLKSEIMRPNDVYYLNALGIHESLKIQQSVSRSLIRINFHPDYVWNQN